jgi:hypothetical protein
MGNFAINAGAASSSEVTSTQATSAQNQADPSSSFLKRAASNLANSLKETMNFAKNHKLAFASLIVAAVFAGPIAGAAAFGAALLLESAWTAASRQKGQVQTENAQSTTSPKSD